LPNFLQNEAYSLFELAPHNFVGSGVPAYFKVFRSVEPINNHILFEQIAITFEAHVQRCQILIVDEIASGKIFESIEQMMFQQKFLKSRLIELLSCLSQESIDIFSGD
jgi:hypothetical protein